MNPDAHEASETLDAPLSDVDQQTLMADYAEAAAVGNAPRGIPMVARFRKDGLGMETIAAGHDQVARYQAAGSDEAYIAGEEALAVTQDMRLKRCGLVYNEGQLTGQKWVAPPGAAYAQLVKILPLYMVKPTPGLEITATDGERYLLPADFKGDWFSVVSPKKVKLIP